MPVINRLLFLTLLWSFALAPGESLALTVIDTYENYDPGLVTGVEGYTSYYTSPDTQGYGAILVFGGGFNHPCGYSLSTLLYQEAGNQQTQTDLGIEAAVICTWALHSRAKADVGPTFYYGPSFFSGPEPQRTTYHIHPGGFLELDFSVSKRIGVFVQSAYFLASELRDKLHEITIGPGLLYYLDLKNELLLQYNRTETFWSNGNISQNQFLVGWNRILSNEWEALLAVGVQADGKNTAYGIEVAAIWSNTD